MWKRTKSSLTTHYSPEDTGTVGPWWQDTSQTGGVNYSTSVSILFYLLIESYYVAQAGLELAM